MEPGLVRRHLSITGFYHLALYGEKVRMPALLMLASIIPALFAYYASYIYNPHEQDYIGRALDLGALIVPMSSCQLDRKQNLPQMTITVIYRDRIQSAASIAEE